MAAVIDNDDSEPLVRTGDVGIDFFVLILIPSLRYILRRCDCTVGTPRYITQHLSL